ncbi:MAG: hypothetical protein QM765_46380 [Myxococcales bacterium]
MRLARCGAALGAFLFLALPGSALACGGNEGSMSVTVLGWTDGGRLFAWKVETVPPGDEGYAPPMRVDLETLDVRTSEHKIVATYELAPEPEADDEGKVDPEQKAEYEKQLKAREKAEAWLKTHPSTPAKSDRTSPDGSARLEAEVEFGNTDDKGTWTDKGWSGNASLLTRLFVVRGDKKAVSLITPDSVATAYWSPDGKRVVWSVGGEKFRVGPAGASPAAGARAERQVRPGGARGPRRARGVGAARGADGPGAEGAAQVGGLLRQGLRGRRASSSQGRARRRLRRGPDLEDRRRPGRRAGRQRWEGRCQVKTALPCAGAFAALAILMVPVAAEAQYAPLENPGWTKSGSHFSYSNFSAGAVEVSVVDAMTGIETSECAFHYDDGSLCSSVEKDHEDTVASQTSPDGKGKAEVVLVMKKGSGKWEGGKFVREASFETEFRVVRDGVSRVSATVPRSVTHVTPYWSPDGKRIAWVIDDGYQQCGMMSCSLISAVIGSAGGVNVQLLADNALLSKVVRPAAKAVAAAGLTPAFVGKALKAREKSAIYFAEGFQAQADKIAKALPGGASVEKLTWKSPADIVVAVGASAVPAAPAKAAQRK